MDKIIEDEFNYIQNQLKNKVNKNTMISVELINLVAGVDVSYFEEDGIEYGACCIVVIDYKTHKIIERKNFIDKTTIPYIAGYLAFREFPLFVGAYAKLVNKPDVFMFDGNGYLHPRHMGLASYAGVILGIPTIGVAKSYLKIDDTEYTMPYEIAGSYTDIIVNNEVYGRVLRSRDNIKPIFISIGNLIDLDDCIKITLSLIENSSKLPITTRFADLYTHEVKLFHVIY